MSPTATSSPILFTATRDDVTLIIAIIGAALGIWNSIAAWRRERIRLKVTPVF